MGEKLFGAADILKLFKKIGKRIDDLECFIEKCCEKTIVNIGNGIGIYKDFSGGNWRLKSLVEGSNVTITDNGNDITISADGGTITGTPTEILYFDSNGDVTSDSNAVRDETTQQTRISKDFSGTLSGGFIITDNNLILSSPFVGNYSTDSTSNNTVFNGIIENSPPTTITGILNSNGDVSYLQNIVTGANEMKWLLGVDNTTFNSTSTSFVASGSGTEWAFTSPTSLKYYIDTNIGWNAAGTVFALPQTDGSSGDVMTTDGAGNITFQTPASSGGTVTNVSALTLGTTGTDLSSTVANSTTTPVITLNVPTASSLNRGALSSADWTTFNSKQPGDATLTALAAYNTNGLLTQTAADTFTGRTITAGTGISITNGDGVAGNPVITATTAGTQLLMTATQTTTSNVAGNITDLVYAASANTVYTFHGQLSIACSSAGGVKFAVTVPAGATLQLLYYGFSTSATNFLMQGNNASGTLTGTAHNRVASDGAVLVFGTITTTGTAGNIQFQFASGVNTQTSTIYKEGTFINVR